MTDTLSDNPALHRSAELLAESLYGKSHVEVPVWLKWADQSVNYTIRYNEALNNGVPAFEASTVANTGVIVNLGSFASLEGMLIAGLAAGEGFSGGTATPAVLAAYVPGTVIAADLSSKLGDSYASSLTKLFQSDSYINAKSSVHDWLNDGAVRLASIYNNGGDIADLNLTKEHNNLKFIVDATQEPFLKIGDTLNPLVDLTWDLGKAVFGNAYNIATANFDIHNASNTSSYSVGSTADISNFLPSNITVQQFINANPANQYLSDRFFSSSGSDYLLLQPTDVVKLGSLGDWNFFDPTIQTSPWLQTVLNGLGYASTLLSPIVLDLDGNGVQTLNAFAHGVYFDIDNDGFAEQIGWINGGDGHLAMDRNSNGIIDNITELFGNDNIPAYKKLALLDSNHDGTINASDTDFTKLSIWKDTNENAETDPGELKTLTQWGIKSISLTEKQENTYNNENYISTSSVFTKTDGTTGKAYDIQYLNNDANSDFVGYGNTGSPITIQFETVFLPHSRGYGTLPALHIAMSNDPVLLDLVKQLTNLSFDKFDQAPDLVQSILFEWAGVENNDPHSRQTGDGLFIDSRYVDFMEKFTGQPILQMGVFGVVGEDASVEILSAWNKIAYEMSNRLMAQGPLKTIFHDATYDFATDKIILHSSYSTILADAQSYASNENVSSSFWQQIGNVLIENKQELLVTTDQINASLSALSGQKFFLADGSFTTVANQTNDLIYGLASDDNISGNGGNDTIYGDKGTDVIHGNQGDDLVYGGVGLDNIFRDDGNDTLYGDDNEDQINGGIGEDVLHGGGQNDVLEGGVGADILDGGEGSDTASYRFSIGAVYVNLLTKTYSGADAQGDQLISIENLRGSGYGDTLIGDDASNNIHAGGHSSVDGGAGDDTLFAEQGGSTIKGGAGNDWIASADGADTIDGGLGADTLDYSHPYIDTAIRIDMTAGRAFGGLDNADQTYWAEGDQFTGIETIVATRFNDTLEGNTEKNTIYGLDGNDILDGKGSGAGLHGSDVLIGGGGDDRYVYNVGYGLVNFSEEVESYYSKAGGVDTIVFGPNIAFQNLKAEVNGTSLKIYLNNTAIINIGNFFDSSKTIEKMQFSDGSQIDIFQAFGLPDLFDGKAATISGGNQNGATLQGGTGNDLILGTQGHDSIFGGGGVDTIYGYAGNDSISNGAIVYGGDGNDSIYGFTFADAGDGNDVIKSVGSSSSLQSILYAGDGNDSFQGATNFEEVVFAGNGNDTLVAVGLNDSMYGENGNDSIQGGTFNNGSFNLLDGGAGNDSITSSVGSDTVIGGADNDLLDDPYGGDLLQGGSGNDTLVGEKGAVTMEGGTGSDIFRVYNGGLKTGASPIVNINVTITDFDVADSNEKIDLANVGFLPYPITNIDQIELSQSGNNAIVTLPGGSTITLKNVQASQLNETHFVDMMGPSIGGEFRVSDVKEGYQRDVDAVQFSNGNTLAVWSSYAYSSTNPNATIDTYGKLFDNQGNAISGSIPVLTKPTQLSDLHIGLLKSGNAVIVGAGSGLNQGVTSNGIFTQIVNSQGQAVGLPTTVATFHGTIESAPSLTTLDNGNFVVAWLRRVDDSGGVHTQGFAQLFNASGVKVGAEILVGSIEDNLFERKFPNLREGGFFSPLSNTIYLHEKVFDGFARGESFNEYQVSHELGHAKQMYTRRGALVAGITATGSAVIGSAIGYGVNVATDKLGVTDSKSWEGADVLAPATGLLAAITGSQAIFRLFTEPNEYDADKHAMTIIGGKKVFDVLVAEASDQVKRSLGEEIYRTRRAEFRKIATQQAGRKLKFTEQELDGAFVIDLAALNAKDIQLERIMKGNFYPTSLERVDHFREQKSPTR